MAILRFFVIHLNEGFVLSGYQMDCALLRARVSGSAAICVVNTTIQTVVMMHHPFAPLKRRRHKSSSPL